jgi:hypothetical protein
MRTTKFSNQVTTMVSKPLRTVQLLTSRPPEPVVWIFLLPVLGWVCLAVCTISVCASSGHPAVCQCVMEWITWISPSFITGVRPMTLVLSITLSSFLRNSRQVRFRGRYKNPFTCPCRPTDRCKVSVSKLRLSRTLIMDIGQCRAAVSILCCLRSMLSVSSRSKVPQIVIS